MQLEHPVNNSIWSEEMLSSTFERKCKLGKRRRRERERKLQFFEILKTIELSWKILEAAIRQAELCQALQLKTCLGLAACHPSNTSFAKMCSQRQALVRPMAHH